MGSGWTNCRPWLIQSLHTQWKGRGQIDWHYNPIWRWNRYVQCDKAFGKNKTKEDQPLRKTRAKSQCFSIVLPQMVSSILMLTRNWNKWRLTHTAKYRKTVFDPSSLSEGKYSSWLYNTDFVRINNIVWLLKHILKQQTTVIYFAAVFL